ncbi:MAG: hypothetical protein CMN77_18505 [Spirochaetaceae bacterium]|nr:hypothetical protein [Spirochaetaceae bacterium]|tara:strand:- start:1075 stop:1341 length:267 start_codon:yes stop_codon:yes gene_type:complete
MSLSQDDENQNSTANSPASGSGEPDKSKGKRISRQTIETLLEQNRRMRDLLESWPARKIMMGFEKDWNEKRLRFLDNNSPVTLESDSE